jgi:hypothetical protein
MPRPNDRYQLDPFLHEVLTLAFLLKDSMSVILFPMRARCDP